jgi:hypothetical protein
VTDRLVSLLVVSLLIICCVCVCVCVPASQNSFAQRTSIERLFVGVMVALFCLFVCLFSVFFFLWLTCITICLLCFFFFFNKSLFFVFEKLVSSLTSLHPVPLDAHALHNTHVGTKGMICGERRD